MKQRNLYSPFSLCEWWCEELTYFSFSYTMSPKFGVAMESSVLTCSPVFYAVLDLWLWISDITWIMCGKQSCEHHHWRYKVHWQLHHNSAVHLLFMLAQNQRCQSLVFHCHFISDQKWVPYIKCIFSPAEKGTCSPKHCATGLSNSESWWTPFPQTHIYILPTNHLVLKNIQNSCLPQFWYKTHIQTTLERSNSVPSSDMEKFYSHSKKGLVH